MPSVDLTRWSEGGATSYATDPRARLTSDLLRWVQEYDSLTSKAGAIKTKIFMHTYEWVQYTLEQGLSSDIKGACIRLGSTLKRGWKGVETWYYCGAYMHEHGLDPAAVDHRSVRVVYQRRRSLSRADHLSVLSMIRQGEPYAVVRAFIARSASAAASDAERKKNRLMRKGELTPRRLRMEAMALRTMVGGLYESGSRIEVVVFVDGRETIHIG